MNLVFVYDLICEVNIGIAIAESDNILYNSSHIVVENNEHNYKFLKFRIPNNLVTSYFTFNTFTLLLGKKLFSVIFGI